MRHSRFSGRTAFYALMLGLPVAAAAQDGTDGGYRSAEVAGWAIVQPELVANPDPYDVVRGSSMSRRAEGYFIEYEVGGGLKRTIGVQRLSCGEATDENGGALYTAALFKTGSIQELATAARAGVSEADAAFDDACPARPAQLQAALTGFEEALAIVEQWASERPLPEIEAWELGNMSIERVEPPVTIRYGRPPGDEDIRLLGVDVNGCGEPYSFSEEVTLPPADASRARAALAELLGQATAQCNLAPDQPARLIAGFEEAAARAESVF